MKFSKRLKYIKNIGGIDYYKYTPSIFKPYYTQYQSFLPISFIHRIRMLLELLQGGYSVYYMVVNSEVVGYLCVCTGRCRLQCVGKEDITIGPIWITPTERGKNYATKGIHAILECLDIVYNYAYEFIKPTNEPSIRTVEKNKFEKIGWGSSRGLLRKIYLSSSGDFLIYKYNKVKNA